MATSVRIQTASLLLLIFFCEQGFTSYVSKDDMNDEENDTAKIKDAPSQSYAQIFVEDENRDVRNIDICQKPDVLQCVRVIVDFSALTTSVSKVEVPKIGDMFFNHSYSDDTITLTNLEFEGKLNFSQETNFIRGKFSSQFGETYYLENCEEEGSCYIFYKKIPSLFDYNPYDEIQSEPNCLTPESDCQSVNINFENLNIPAPEVYVPKVGVLLLDHSEEYSGILHFHYHSDQNSTGYIMYVKSRKALLAKFSSTNGEKREISTCTLKDSCFLFYATGMMTATTTNIVADELKKQEVNEMEECTKSLDEAKEKLNEINPNWLEEVHIPQKQKVFSDNFLESWMSWEECPNVCEGIHKGYVNCTETINCQNTEYLSVTIEKKCQCVSAVFENKVLCWCFTNFKSKFQYE